MSLNYENVGKNVIYNRSVDNIEDYVKGTIVGCYIGQDEEYYVTSIESSGECIKVYDDSLIEIIEGGGSGAVSSVNGQTGTVVLDAEDVGAAQDSLKLTATPTVGPSGTTLMGGTWSGATWEEVVTAIQASRLIQVDVTNIGKITLLYNLDSATKALSNACAYIVNGILYSVFVELQIDDGANLFLLSIINARTETINISGTTPTIEPQANTTYNCGEVTSLTISNPPATGAYSIVFTSGSTATTTTFPATILGLEDFAAEANTLYEINVLDNRAVVGSWAVTP